MKTLTTLMLCLVILTGCKKSTTNNPSTSIVGKWIHVKTILYNADGSIADNTTINDPKNYVQFNSDGSGIISSDQSGSLVLTSFTYTLSNNTITIVYTGGTEVDTIKSITANSLVLHSTTDGDIVDDYFSK